MKSIFDFHQYEIQIQKLKNGFRLDEFEYNLSENGLYLYGIEYH